MGSTWQRGIVVGVDGSPQSMAAVDWAALTADRHGAPLTVLSAYVSPPANMAGTMGVSVTDLRDRANDAVERGAARLDGARPGGHGVEEQVVHGDPAQVLAQRSASADLVVVGRRGLGALDRAVLGSVSGALAAAASGPVAVIPSGAATGEPSRVVVAVSDDDADPQLDLGFAEAQQRACPLVALHVREPGLAAGLDLGGPDTQHQEAERDGVRRQVARWSEKYPSVAPTVVLGGGNPVDVLLDELGPDDVLVLGGRPHSPTAGRLRYSVADAVLRRSRNPVIVAHHQVSRHTKGDEPWTSSTRRSGGS
ncbi:universal stress protein [Promicromonospora sukumoe]|uniref:universal stress protein n=1 Tax=Promicromonospora sukumoe TaxID=88382 RepID=UPI000375E929|nr:universal stress protein [Promicromonospora sukumoe]